MKTVLLLFLFLGTANLKLLAQQDEHAGHNHGTQAVPASTAQDFLIIKEKEFDFGKIPQGKPVTHEFEVMNTGKEELTISNVQASCGCTTPEWERDKPIAPGGTTRIKVGYNAASEGLFTKSITVTYGDSQSKQILIKGEVWKTPATSAPENKGLDDLKN